MKEQLRVQRGWSVKLSAGVSIDWTGPSQKHRHMLAMKLWQLSPTGSDPEPGEEVRGSNDTQCQDRRGTDRGKL